MTAATSFIAGLALVGAVGFAVAQVPDRGLPMCRPGYSHAQRLPPASYYPIAKEVYRRAGIPWSEREGYRLDHIVPLCLGGTWSLENLQIQTIEAAATKDRVEVQMCRAYCAGEISLRDAQARFRRD